MCYPTGEGKITTIYDRVNFYRDIKNDSGVHFERDGNNIILIAGDGTIINDKLIAKGEDAFNHDFDTYIPVKKGLNENQQTVFDVLKEESLGTNPFFTIWHAMENDQLFDSKGMDTKQQFQVLAAFAEWGMNQ